MNHLLGPVLFAGGIVAIGVCIICLRRPISDFYRNQFNRFFGPGNVFARATQPWLTLAVGSFAVLLGLVVVVIAVVESVAE